MVAIRRKSDAPDASFVIVTETHEMDCTGEELGKPGKPGKNQDFKFYTILKIVSQKSLDLINLRQK